MNKQLTITGLAVGVLLLGGCAAGTAAAPSVQFAAQSAAAHGATQGPTAVGKSASESPAGTPPQAAAMVCSAEARGNVTKILGLASPPKTDWSWNGTVYACHYALEAGTLTMSVQVFPEATAAREGAATLSTSLDAKPIQGLSNLGLPGYQAEAGTVVFAKDNMVLHVDATTMPAAAGINHVTRSAFAYQMATTILACWSEH
ncbi:hypothetical protein QO003_001675 [Arthrobacter silviterrae]|uniref:DUF3558 domain-containing protein n=1 Tax=Arthrobacter silviterrae TaxID=2026658 RepID=A0ABX0DMU7_9MICC|nr:hypothetical protein [Arthrobacter silviterrae]MDQ0277372.1 hypothetical protein [Arthrobacter silviterrae]NGN85548.1 hypothetical protein [Arthrobacter silviterrae]